MTDRYVAIGNPVRHSKSPLIHLKFAELNDQNPDDSIVEAELDGFRQAAETPVRQAVAA